MQFADISTTSKASFHLAEICIAGFSSSQFERLFGGFKAILAPMGEMDDHFLDDSLIPIIANSHLELLALIDQYTGCSENEFFLNKEFRQYHWSWYLDKYPLLKLKTNS